MNTELSLSRIFAICDQRRADKRAEPYRTAKAVTVPQGAWWLDDETSLEMKPIPDDQYVPIIPPGVREAVLYEQRMRRLQDRMYDCLYGSPVDGSAEDLPAEEQEEDQQRQIVASSTPVRPSAPETEDQGEKKDYPVDQREAHQKNRS